MQAFRSVVANVGHVLGKIEVCTGVCTRRANPACMTRLTRISKPFSLRRGGQNAPGRNRTCDLSLRRRTLYPLSYGRGVPLSLARMKLSARIVTLPLAETFVISRESQDEVDLVEVELRHDGVS